MRNDDENIGRFARAMARNVQRLAAERCIPLAHLADKAGIGRTTMWRMLDVHDKGASDPRLSTVGKLADALGVSPGELLVDVEPALDHGAPPASPNERWAS